MRERQFIPRLAPRSAWRGNAGPVLALLTALLALGAAAPAHATTTVDATNSPFTINATNSPFIDDIVVNSGGELDVVTGGSLAVQSGAAVTVNGGTLNLSGGAISDADGAVGVKVNIGTVNISGGSISGSNLCLQVNSGTANISGGSISGLVGVSVSAGTANISGGSFAGDGNCVSVSGGTANISGGSLTGVLAVRAISGTANISGGSISGSAFGVAVDRGTANILGCGLVLSGGTLTGTLRDGTAIHTPAILTFAGSTGTGQIVLNNAPPVITCPPSVTVSAETGLCSAPVSAAAVATSCGISLLASGVRSDGKLVTDPYPVGMTTITWTATDAVGQQATCMQTITVKNAEPPTISGAAANPARLWPPDQQMVSVTINYTAAGTCGAVTSTLSVSNNETGTADATVVDAHHVLLRAARAGSGPGRVYTITITATDASGNVTTQTVSVTVPHSQ